MGAFALSHAELEQESHVMTGGVEKTEAQSSSKDELANKEPLEDLCDTNIKQAYYSMSRMTVLLLTVEMKII